MFTHKISAPQRIASFFNTAESSEAGQIRAGRANEAELQHPLLVIVKFKPNDDVDKRASVPHLHCGEQRLVFGLVEIGEPIGLNHGSFVRSINLNRVWLSHEMSGLASIFASTLPDLAKPTKPSQRVSLT